MQADSIPDERSVVDKELKVQLMKRAHFLSEYVRRRIPAMLQPVISIEDVLQEVWLGAFQADPKSRPTTSEGIDRWLMTIARHRLLNVVRNARRKKRMVRGRVCPAPVEASSWLDLFQRVASIDRTPSSVEAAQEGVRAVQRAVGTLPVDERKAITHHYLEGRSQEETARLIRRSKPATNSLLFRAMRRLRGELGSAARFFSDAEQRNDEGSSASHTRLP